MNWKDILKIEEDIEKGWSFPKKDKGQQPVTTEYTPEQKDKINVFSNVRGVSAEQAASWLYQNNWKLPRDVLVAFQQLR